MGKRAMTSAALALTTALALPFGAAAAPPGMDEKPTAARPDRQADRLEIRDYQPLADVSDEEKLADLRALIDTEARKGRLVVVDYWTEWCMPCKLLEPILIKSLRELDVPALLIKVNADMDNSQEVDAFLWPQFKRGIDLPYIEAYRTESGELKSTGFTGFVLAPDFFSDFFNRFLGKGDAPATPAP